MKVSLTKNMVEAIVRAYLFFQDYGKARVWLCSKNLNFGGFSPVELIHRGRGFKVIEFINAEIGTDGLKLPVPSRKFECFVPAENLRNIEFNRYTDKTHFKFDIAEQIEFDFKKLTGDIKITMEVMNEQN
jgi:hypothetical protein